MTTAKQTRAVVEALYASYADADLERMLAIMSDDVEVTFLAQGTYRGRAEITPFFEYSGGLLVDLDWRLERLLVDGCWATAIWTETAVTYAGAPWASTGVDVVRVDAGRITELRMYNDAALSRRLFPGFVPPATS